MERQLAENRYIAGDEYTIADIAIWSWYGQLAQGKLYDAGEFLDVASYKNVQRWTNEIAERKGVKRGRVVNRVRGEENEKLEERHSAADIDAMGL